MRMSCARSFSGAASLFRRDHHVELRCRTARSARASRDEKQFRDAARCQSQCGDDPHSNARDGPAGYPIPIAQARGRGAVSRVRRPPGLGDRQTPSSPQLAGGRTRRPSLS